MHRKPTIFISISSGAIARNFLAIPGGFLEHAKKCFERIVVIVPEGTKEHFVKEYADKQVLIEPIAEDNYVYENNTLIKNLFSFFYTYLLFGDNARGLAWEGMYLSQRPKDTWSGRLSYPVKWFIGSTFGKSNWVRTKLVPFLDSLIHRKEWYAELFRRYEPHLVFVPNVEKWQDICLIRESRKRGIPSVGMPGSWDHLPKRFRPLHSDLLLVNTYTQKNEAIRFQSYAESQIHIVGVPYYDAFSLKEYFLSRTELCERVGLDPQKKIIFFSSESVYAPDDGDVAGMLYQWIENDVLKEKVQLFIRPYPGVSAEHEKFDHLNGKENVYIDWVENRLKRNAADGWYPTLNEIIDFASVLYHADIIINTYSSIAIEAAYFSKQAIWINFDGYKDHPWDMSVKRFSTKVHLKNILETEGVKLVNSREELKKAIDLLLTSEEVDPKVEILRHKMCGPLDGRTGERIVNFLVDFATQKNERVTKP